MALFVENASAYVQASRATRTIDAEARALIISEKGWEDGGKTFSQTFGDAEMAKRVQIELARVVSGSVPSLHDGLLTVKLSILRAARQTIEREVATAKLENISFDITRNGGFGTSKQ